jgi:hypothetical protein
MRMRRLDRQGMRSAMAARRDRSVYGGLSAAAHWAPNRATNFLPISMPIVATVAIDLLDMAVLRLTLAPSQHYSPVGQEHGRTIPLADALQNIIFADASTRLRGPDGV